MRSLRCRSLGEGVENLARIGSVTVVNKGTADLLPDIAWNLEGEPIFLRRRQRVVWLLRADRHKPGACCSYLRQHRLKCPQPQIAVGTPTVAVESENDRALREQLGKICSTAICVGEHEFRRA